MNWQSNVHASGGWGSDLFFAVVLELILPPRAAAKGFASCTSLTCDGGNHTRLLRARLMFSLDIAQAARCAVSYTHAGPHHTPVHTRNVLPSGLSTGA